MERSTFINEVKGLVEWMKLRALVTPIFGTNDIMVDILEPGRKSHKTFNCDKNDLEEVREFLKKSC